MKDSFRWCCLMLAWCALISVTACTTVNGRRVVDPVLGSAVVRVSVGVGLSKVLTKNPRYIPAARALAGGIDVALGKATTLSQDGIAEYVTDVCKRHDVDPESIGEFVMAAQGIYTAYIEANAVTVVSTQDPKVRLYVNAFKNGLSDAVINAQRPK